MIVELSPSCRLSPQWRLILTIVVITRLQLAAINAPSRQVDSGREILAVDIVWLAETRRRGRRSLIIFHCGKTTQEEPPRGI